MPNPLKSGEVAASGRLDSLRRAFDASFAEPAAGAREEGVAVLAVRVGGRDFALRLADLAGVAAGRRVVPLPAAHPRVLGLVGLRGQLVPVLDLAAFLGLAGSEAPRWVALAGATPPVGFAIDAVVAYVRCAAADVLAAPPGNPLVVGAVRLGEGLVPLVDLALVAQQALNLVTPDPRPPEP